jgi:glutamyl-tRNA synthetase
MKSVRVRFPPSPTGYCHVGTGRMAVLNYLFAKKHDGTIIFRSEDTDQERSSREFEEDIIEQLHWLGLSWETFYRTTDMLERHKEAISALVAAGKAYVSSEPSKKDPSVIAEVVRLKNPGKTITFADEIRGEITVDTTDLGDFVIGRSIDDPLYHLAVVVDDASDGITHIIRGEDHISNTPRQILIQEALGYPRPVYAHYPLHLASDRTKLSKRKGDVAIRSYREKGFLPEAVFNYLATLGWTPPSGKEVLSREEMIAEFNLHDLHKSAAVFDVEKLRWFNRQYIERMTESAFRDYAYPQLTDALGARVQKPDDRVLSKVVPLLRERISVAADIAELVQEGELDFFFAEPILDTALIPEKKSNPKDALRHLSVIVDRLHRVDANNWNSEGIKDALWQYATEEGRGAVLWPMRYALSGRTKSPDPFSIAAVIGKDETIKRLEKASAALQNLV